MDSRPLDKRKVREKESDTESNDSQNKNGTKRPRVDFSSSPKEKSPSPGAAQRSPVKMMDSFTAATAPAALSESNGDVDVAGSSTNNNDTPAVISSKFDLPPPFTSQELEQKIGKNEEDSDSDGGSTKFYSDLMKSEEDKKKRQGRAGSNNPEGVNGTSPTHNSTIGSMRSTGTTTTSRGNGTAHRYQPSQTSSPLSSVLSDSMGSENFHLNVAIRITHPITDQVLLDTTVIKTDYRHVESFLRQHDLTLSDPSHSSLSSGYLGDISSSQSSDSLGSTILSNSNKSSSNSNRWTLSSVSSMSSLGSTIPRHSIVSVATTDDGNDDSMRRPLRPPLVSRARKRSDGPVMSSTKFEDDSISEHSVNIDRMNVSKGISNGAEIYLSSSSSSSSSGKSQSPVNSQNKKAKSTPSNTMEGDEGIGVSSANSSTPRKGVAVKGNAKSQTPAASSSASKPAGRRRGSSNFPIAEPTSGISKVLSTPPPARSVARIEGTSAKPLSRFEQEMNNEPVIESELQKSETLWSTILPEELVFARWRDKNYYSGMVKSKGLNDTWVIDYDDGMNDVASETHIIPVRILGVGVTGIFSPDDHYEAKPAVIIGQKFQADPDTGLTAVKYAIRCTGDDKPIWCSRRQLSIKEADAKRLRPEYTAILGGKAGDVSTDNIVSGPRRRTRGGTSEGVSTTPSASAPKKRVVAGAFDESSADDQLLAAASTPKGSKGGEKGAKMAKGGTKRKRAEVSVSTPQASQTEAKVEPTPSTSQAIAPPVPTIEFGKKRPKKILFQGMQFLLTASGGTGDTDNPMQPSIPYDKEEYRELIENAGGEILEIVGSEAEKTENVFLISDCYARTVKYIYCLASSIPCVAHTWIKQCLDNLEIVDWSVFTLPAGWSIEHQDLIGHHVKKPLKGCRVFVTSESDQLYNYWKPVLTAAEAVMLKLPKKKGIIIPNGTEVIVTDQHESASIRELLQEAEKQKLPVVKPEWLVQTIILGERAHLYGTLKYTITGTDTEDTEDTTRDDDSAMESGANEQKAEVLDQSQE